MDLSSVEEHLFSIHAILSTYSRDCSTFRTKDSRCPETHSKTTPESRSVGSKH